MSLQLILISLWFHPLVLLRFATSPSPTHVMYPFARFPFARFLKDIVQVESPMILIHTCEFTHTNLCVINQPIRICMWSINRTISYLQLGISSCPITSAEVPSILTQPLCGYLVLPTRLSIVGLLWRILFCPTNQFKCYPVLNNFIEKLRVTSIGELRLADWFRYFVS